MSYFENIPNIEYNGKIVKNVFSRAQFSKDFKDKNNSLLNYSLKDGERADIIADKYYDDPDYSWLVWMSNNVVDPYYDLPLSENDFEAFIISKYGSVELAKSTIIHFRNNWEEDNIEMSITNYNLLSPNLKKYYNPNIDYKNDVLSYRRKKKNWVVKTHRMISFDVDDSEGLSLEQRIVGTNFSFVIDSINGNNLIVKHAYGNPTGLLPSTTSTVSSSIITLATPIPTDELFLWKAVSYYDYELELNEEKRNIKLLDNRLTLEAEKELKRVFR